MTIRNFRVLLIASFLVGVIGGGIDLVFPAVLPETFHQAMEAENLVISVPRVLLLGILGVILLITTLAAYYGLYMLHPWAPKLSLFATVSALLCVLTSGVSVQSGFSVAATYLASYLWGAILFLVFLPPFSDQFRANAA